MTHIEQEFQQFEQENGWKRLFSVGLQDFTHVQHESSFDLETRRRSTEAHCRKKIRNSLITYQSNIKPVS